jgi:hypothetical protein
MPWEPGKSGNPSGYNGPRDRQRREVFERIQALKHADALETLSSIQNAPNADTAYRVAAASALAPYLHPKLQSVPTPRFIDLQLDVPEFTHVSDAENFLAKIALLVARGHLDIQSGQELSGLVKTWIDTQYTKDELQFKINPPEQRDQVIRIENSLPQLPGTRITMPVLNGNAVSEQLLSAPNDVIPPEAPDELTPGQLKAVGPHPLQKHHFEPEPDEPGKNSTNGQGPETQGGDTVSNAELAEILRELSVPTGDPALADAAQTTEGLHARFRTTP